MRSIYLIVFLGLTACGHTQPSEVEIAPKQETKNKVPKGKNVLAVLGCVGGCKSALDEVLNSAPNSVPAEKAHTLEKKTDVKPSHGRKFAQESGIFAALKGSSVKKIVIKVSTLHLIHLRVAIRRLPKRNIRSLQYLVVKNLHPNQGKVYGPS